MLHASVTRTTVARTPVGRTLVAWPVVVAAVMLVAACTASHAQHGAATSAPSARSAPSAEWTTGATVAQLPLQLPTAGSRQVITVTAASTSSTVAQLQAWAATSQHGWVAYGPAVTAHVGSGGLTTQENETLTATPIGSITLTQAFGRLPNPGTRLPYFQTTPNDWWVSQQGPYYNTHQVCIAACPFTEGSPNSRLFYVAPQYNLAVVIDFNRHPVVQGGGSGVFLHVTRGVPTAGCVSVASPDLVRIMRWLRPTDRPRILIGIGRT